MEIKSGNYISVEPMVPYFCMKSVKSVDNITFMKKNLVETEADMKTFNPQNFHKM